VQPSTTVIAFHSIGCTTLIFCYFLLVLTLVRLCTAEGHYKIAGARAMALTLVSMNEYVRNIKGCGDGHVNLRPTP
jgi:hypothetical protein